MNFHGLIRVATVETINAVMLANCRLNVASHRNYTHMTWLINFDFESLLGYQKTFRKMGAAFVHN